MREILIWQKCVVATTEDDVRLRIFPLLYKKGDQLADAYEATAEEIQNLQAFRSIKAYFFQRSFLLPLPERVLKGLRKNMFKYLADHNDDCYDFVNDVFGVERHPKEQGYRHWGVVEGRRARKPGDVIFLLDLKEHLFRHAAIYIGRGYCISVHGKSGAVGVSKLDHMVRDYGAQDVCTMWGVT